MGNSGALGKVPKLNALIIALAALGLAGCASTSPESASATAPAPGRIVLVPSDDVFKAAVQDLSPTEQKVLKKGLGFTVDTLLTAPTPVETMAWSKKRPDTPVSVKIADYVRYVDLQPSLGGGTRVNLATARVLAGLTYDEATFNPVFRLVVEVEPSTSGVTTATGLGDGPACKRPGDESPPGSAALTRSEQIAFMKAFLKTLLKIKAQLLQT
jgi:hypothetical protein